MSSSEDLSAKSTKALPVESKEGREGGSFSKSQILFLANPCCSSDPRVPNFFLKEQTIFIRKEIKT